MSSFRHLFGRTLFGRCTSSSRQNYTAQRCKKSTLTEPVASPFKLKTLSQYEISSFKNLLPELVNDLTHKGEHQGMPSVTEHLTKVMSVLRKIVCTYNLHYVLNSKYLTYLSTSTGDALVI